MGTSYLLTRDAEVRPPSNAVLPTLTALVDTSGVVSDVLLRGARAGDVRQRAAFLRDPELGTALRQIVSNRLVSVGERASGLSTEWVERLRELEELLGIDVGDWLVGDDDGASLAAALQPGTRVCFTGTARSPDGRVMSRRRRRLRQAPRSLATSGRAMASLP